MKSRFPLFFVVILFLTQSISFGQAPPLGTTSSFALFTAAGAFSNIGNATIVTGDVGTNAGAFSAFPPGALIGQIHVVDAVSATAATDVAVAYGNLSTLSGSVLGVTLGNGQILTPGIYNTGAAATLNGNLILDAQNDPNAIFIIRIGGAFSTSTNSNVILINSANLCNVYWQVAGEFDLGDFSIFRGTVVASGAIHLLEGSTLLGRALTTAGAIELHNNIVTNSCGGCIPPVAPTATVTAQPTCTISTGTITVTAPANGAGITYTITGTNPVTAPGTNATGLFTGLAPGNYNVTVTVAGCTSPPIPLTINAVPGAPVAPTATVTAQPTCTVSTGTITVTAPANGAGITYTVTGTNPYVAPVTNATGLFTGLAPGIYNVTTTSNAECASAPTLLTVKAVSGAPAAPNANVTQPNCIVSTGTITVTAPKGTGMTYSIDGLNYTNTSGIFNLVPANTYIVTAKSADGCISAGISVTINAPANPTAFVIGAITQPTCAVPTGSVELTGLPSGNWTINPGGITGSTTSTVITGLAPGTYGGTVTNEAGCTSEESAKVVIIGQIGQAALTTVKTTSTTSYAAVGDLIHYSITVTNIGNIRISGITLSDPNATITCASSQNTLASGTNLKCATVPFLEPHAIFTCTAVHTVTQADLDACSVTNIATTIGTDANGCEVTNDSNPVTVKSTLCLCTAPIVSVVNNCGSSTLSIPPGGTILWSNGATSNSITVTTAGSYTVTRTVDGCTKTGPGVASPKAVPTAPLIGAITQPTCEVAAGTITVTAPANGVGVTYTLTGTTPVVAPVTNATGIFTGLKPGDYNVTTSIGECTSSPISLTINAIPPSILAAPTANLTQPTCAVNTGTIVVTSPLGCNVEYSKDGITWQSSTTFSGLTRGTTYTIRARILSTADFVISLLTDGPSASVVKVTQPTCTVSTGTITVTAPKGTGITYSIDGLTYTNTSGIFDNVASNTYIVTAKSADGCISEGTSVKINAQPEAPTNMTRGAITQPTCEVATGSIVINGLPAGNWIINPGAVKGTGESTTITGLVAGTYHFTVTNEAGCTSVPSHDVVINAPPTALPAPIVSVVNNCGSSTLSILPGGKILWSNGATTASITVSKPGTYKVSRTVGGCTSAPGLGLAAPYTSPTRPANFTVSKDHIRRGEDNVIYAVPNVANVTCSWSYSGKGATITGSRNSVSVCFSSTATSGTLSVKAINNCGTSEAKTLFIDVISPAPCPEDFSESKDHVNCEQNNVRYTVPNIEGVSYVWSYSGKGVSITGSTNSVLVSFSKTATSGTLSVKTFNKWATSDPRSINITVNKNHNKSSTITGDLAPVPFDAFPTKNDLKVFPNPTLGQITFEFQINENAKVTLDLSSISGQQIARIFDTDVKAGITQTVIFGQLHTPGVYLYALRWNNQKITGKFIRQ